MSHTKVKTTYSVQGAYASTETEVLYCHHNHSCDTIIYYDKDGQIQGMAFSQWETNNDLWDAMNRLRSPFKDRWGGELKENVEFYFEDPYYKINALIK